MKYTKENFKQLGKDFKCIGKGFKGIFLGTLNGVKHIVTIPLSLAQDGRDAYLAKKNSKSEEYDVIEPEVVIEQHA